MFQNLPTGRKLFALCAAFILAIAATTYQLVAEKRLAVEFARKELLGSGCLRAVRDVYAAIMVDPSRSNASAVADRLVAPLAAQALVGGLPGIAQSADALVEVLRRDGSSRGGPDVGGLMPETLDKARSLATRIADDSNLSLDPDIARPLARLEAVARTVRETRNYDLRMDHGGDDEIGRLSTAFNDMMSELSHARRREISDHAELARAARLSTAGAMTASIAHEINQPLAAIVNNANAGIRWLASPVPDVPEAQASLKRIVNDGRRAGEVIGSVRSMVRTGNHARDKLDVNNLIREVLSLSHNELHNRRISVRSELRPGLPLVSGDRVQLQQVFLNLISNAAEAMSAVEDRVRRLLVKSERHGLAAVLIEVEDSGSGIDANDVSRIFDPFFTIKADGMGLGLAISRSIIESHGGQLWATPAKPFGSTFHVVLPFTDAEGAQ